MNELPIVLPCPFCGGAAEIKKELNYLEDTYSYYASCLTSRCYGHGNSIVKFPDKVMAVNAWNRRKGVTCSSGILG